MGASAGRVTKVEPPCYWVGGFSGWIRLRRRGVSTTSACPTTWIMAKALSRSGPG